MRGAKRYLQGAGFGLKLGARSDGRFVAGGGLRAAAGKRRSDGSGRVKSHPHWVQADRWANAPTQRTSALSYHARRRLLSWLGGGSAPRTARGGPPRGRTGGRAG